MKQSRRICVDALDVYQIKDDITKQKRTTPYQYNQAQHSLAKRIHKCYDMM